MSSKLEKMALDALAERRAREEQERAAEAERLQQDALRLVDQSVLSTWFPDVEWERVGETAHGVVLVRELAGAPVVFGLRDTGHVGIYEDGSFVTAPSDPAQVGQYLAARSAA